MSDSSLSDISDIKIQEESFNKKYFQMDIPKKNI
jgi:hypothetical protein